MAGGGVADVSGCALCERGFLLEYDEIPFSPLCVQIDLLWA